MGSATDHAPHCQLVATHAGRCLVDEMAEAHDPALAQELARAHQRIAELLTAIARLRQDLEHARRLR